MCKVVGIYWDMTLWSVAGLVLSTASIVSVLHVLVYVKDGSGDRCVVLVCMYEVVIKYTCSV